MNSRQLRKQRHGMRMTIQRTSKSLRRLNHATAQTTGAIIKFNTIYNNMIAGLDIANGPDVTIYGNVFYNTKEPA